MYRGLSSYFYDRISFGLVYKTDVALVKKFNCTAFPAILVYQTHEGYTYLDAPNISFYSGALSTKAVGGFLDYYSVPEKRYITNRRKDFRPNHIKNVDKTSIKDYLKRMEKRRVVVLFTVNNDISKELVDFATMMR